MKLLIATRNQGKLKEMLSALGSAGFEIVGLDEAGIPTEFEVEEPAMTLEGNAIVKAIAYGNQSGLLTLADDTGLEVDALGGRPGVYSARYAPGTDEDRYRTLLRELDGVSVEKRTAQFRAVVAIYDPATGKIRTCEGVYRGRLLDAPSGANGFGYDPIFYCEEKRGSSRIIVAAFPASRSGTGWRSGNWRSCGSPWRRPSRTGSSS